MNDIQTKVCSRCGKEYPKTNEYFYYNKRYKNPKEIFISKCIYCIKKYNETYRMDNDILKIKKRAKSKEYYNKNKNNIKIKQQQYSNNNKDRIKQYHKQYYLKNKNEINEKNKKRNESLEKKESLKEYSKKYYLKNKDKIINKKKEYFNNRPEKKESKKIYIKNWIENNKEKHKQLTKEWYQRNKDKIKDYRQRIHKEYYAKKENKEKRNLKLKERRKNDINFKLSYLLRNRLKCAIKQKKSYKTNSTLKLLGCSVKEFKKYIESFFTENMSWGKILNGEIHLDHILPCAAFDLRNSEEQEICFAYWNYQPLWAKDNLTKRDKIC